MRVIPKMWMEERFGYEGRPVYGSLPERAVFAQAGAEAASADVGGGLQPRYRA